MRIKLVQPVRNLGSDCIFDQHVDWAKLSARIKDVKLAVSTKHSSAFGRSGWLLAYGVVLGTAGAAAGMALGSGAPAAGSAEQPPSAVSSTTVGAPDATAAESPGRKLKHPFSNTPTDSGPATSQNQWAKGLLSGACVHTDRHAHARTITHANKDTYIPADRPAGRPHACIHPRIPSHKRPRARTRVCMPTCTFTCTHARAHARAHTRIRTRRRAHTDECARACIRQGVAK